MATVYAESYIKSPLVQAIGADGVQTMREVLERDFSDCSAEHLESNPELLVSEEYMNKKNSLVEPNTRITPLCQLSRKTEDEALEIAKMLITEYKLVDANHVDLMGQTALFYAARDGWSKFCEFLAQNGCDPNHQDRLGQTCLFYASREGHHETLEALIACKADVNLVDTNKQNCLFYAARDGRMEAVKVLIKHGINYNLKDAQRRQAITFAKLKNQTEIVNLLKSMSKSESQHVKRPLTDPADVQGLLQSASTADEIKSGVPVVVKEAGKPRKYRLQFRPFEDDANLWVDAPLVKIREFELRFPELATWDKTAPFAPLSTLRNPLVKQWHQIGLNLLSMMGKQEGGYVFERPVDPKKQNCPDYFDIVKKPISYSCIRSKIKKNVYTSPKEFVEDCQLVFDNCFKYNKPDTWVAQVGRNIETFFKEQLKELDFEAFINKHDKLNELLETANQYVESNEVPAEAAS
ncbi:bromodomain/ankyrin repeat containing protein, putative [Babesia bigemina]|uniref:Bromodomain/ankyrin repeat containing protein, putative n=1 Tax=Babesia bigemina TaxID=5866 RepID=A0A061D9T3_BABBI|nr:bromodomain/ankyrin repeat containing protein, putative [Babesia bigemina]CDR94495.1 bromodomain/ankyrin repeat containing protein, putative [Babesia bigemina]|eukprot:XP_012766681.1 bromodomain/ankyrin repeat containing protein, putative [Babesia bigemina]